MDELIREKVKVRGKGKAKDVKGNEMKERRRGNFMRSQGITVKELLVHFLRIWHVQYIRYCSQMFFSRRGFFVFFLRSVNLEGFVSQNWWTLFISPPLFAPLPSLSPVTVLLTRTQRILQIPLHDQENVSSALPCPESENNPLPPEPSLFRPPSIVSPSLVKAWKFEPVESYEICKSSGFNSDVDDPPSNANRFLLLSVAGKVKSRGGKVRSASAGKLGSEDARRSKVGKAPTGSVGNR